MMPPAPVGVDPPTPHRVLRLAVTTGLALPCPTLVYYCTSGGCTSHAEASDSNAGDKLVAARSWSRSRCRVADPGASLTRSCVTPVVAHLEQFCTHRRLLLIGRPVEKTAHGTAHTTHTAHTIHTAQTTHTVRIMFFG